MISRLAQALCAGSLLVGAAVACGGGGSAPIGSKAPVASGVASAPPASTTAVGYATLSIALPSVLTAATPAPGSAGASKARRSPAYVNPSTNAVLDIYVDGTLIPNIDGLAGSNDSIKVAATATGLQSAKVPLFSVNTNEIVVLEWDSSSHVYMLAMGEYDVGTFTPGTTVTATVAMQMNAKYVGVVDVPNETSPSLMSGGTWTELSCAGAGSTAQFGVYPADFLGSFVAKAGYGGTSAARLTTATSTGTTSVTQTAVPGIWQITWDANCDSATVSASAPNPAYAIYNDIAYVNYDNYYNAFYGGYDYTAGGHQGIWNLVYGDGNSTVQSGFGGTGTANATGTETIAGVVAVGTVTEYTIPTSGGDPIGITLGPDGNVWFAETNGNKIAKITPAGVITEYSVPTASSLPEELVTGPDNNVWFTETAGNNIGKVTTSGTFTEYPIPTASSEPSGITQGPLSTLWFTEYAPGVNKIAAITTGGLINEYDSSLACCQPGDIALGSDSNLWFTPLSGGAENTVGKSTSGVVTAYSILSPGATPRHIVNGPDGNLWITESGTNKIAKVSTGGSLVAEYTVPTASSYPNGITVGPDSNLWFTEYTGNKIGRLTTGGTFTEYPVPTASAQPSQITSGSDGNLWFTESNGNKIGKIIP